LSLLFGTTLVVEAIIEIPVERDIFTGPPDFIFPVALRPEDIAGGLWPESSTLPQRAVKLLLDGGVLYYSQHPYGLRRALPFVEDLEYSRLLTMLSQQPPSIIHQFPKRIARVPVLAVRAGKEEVAIDEKFLIDYAATGIDQYGDAGHGPIEVFSVGFDSEVTVGIYSQNADVTIFWYEVAKWVLMQARLLLSKLGIDNIMLAGGDIHPQARYLPEDIYIRELVVRCRTRQVYARDTTFTTLLRTRLQVD
jgi:hypothetical protein